MSVIKQKGLGSRKGKEKEIVFLFFYFLWIFSGLYQNGPVCCFKTNSGVTQLEFSPCGTKLYSAVRRSNEFYCWDLRNPGVVLWSMENRQANTNQKINFDISKDGSTIVSGNTFCFVNSINTIQLIIITIIQNFIFI